MKVPKYKEVYQFLRSELKSGKYEVGDKFATDIEVAKSQNVTTMTARQAFKMLIEEGCLERVRGKGTHITSLEPQLTASPTQKASSRRWIYHYQSGVRGDHFYDELFGPFLTHNPNINLEFRQKAKTVYQSSYREDDALHLIEFSGFFKLTSGGLMRHLDFAQDLHKNLERFDQEKVLRASNSPISPVIGVPIVVNNRLPVVNTQLAKSIGLKLDSEYLTYTELKEALTACQKKGYEYPLAHASVGASTNYLFTIYLSNFMARKSSVGDERKLDKDAFISTMKLFRDLYDRFSDPNSGGDENPFWSGRQLIDLFTGPWVVWEHKKSRANFDIKPIVVGPSSTRRNAMHYSSILWLGCIDDGSSLNPTEKELLSEFFNYATQEKFATGFIRSDYPSLSPHVDAARKHMRQNPAISPFYEKRGQLCTMHLIPAAWTWNSISYELGEFFKGKLTLDEFWQRVEWIQSRIEADEEPAI